MLKAVGARRWYLPPYSPDLNPVEKALSKIKHWMRLAQKRPPRKPSRDTSQASQSHPPIRMLQLHPKRWICSRQNVNALGARVQAQPC